MQTFLPDPDFRRSAACLDPRRLGKQRVEAFQLLGAYMNACIDEWVRRGYRNTMRKARVSRYRSPPWLGDPAFHASHRANLLRKDALYYARFGWREDPTLPYVWPDTRTA